MGPTAGGSNGLQGKASYEIVGPLGASLGYFLYDNNIRIIIMIFYHNKSNNDRLSTSGARILRVETSRLFLRVTCYLCPIGMVLDLLARINNNKQ